MAFVLATAFDPLVYGFASVLGLVGIVFISVGIVGFRYWWLMKRLDPQGPVAVEPGLREFEGRVRPVGEPIVSPFTETESLICRYEIERYNLDSDESNWRTVERDTLTTPFEIQHAGSTVAVDPTDAQCLITEEWSLDSREADDLPEAIRVYMDEGASGPSSELDSVDLDSDRRYRFTVDRLDAGEEVYVLGPVKRDLDAVPESDTEYVINPDRSVLKKVFGNPFVIADTGEHRAEHRQLRSAVISIVVGLFLIGAPALFVLTW